MERKEFRDRVLEFRNMSREEFEAYIEPLRGDIWSFPDMTPPNGAALIGYVEREKDTYFYYLDPDFNLYYESASGFRFKKKMFEYKFKRETMG